MNICFTSNRVFADGPVTQPFLESDPANIAYSLGGSYESFVSLKNLTTRQLKELLAPYDLIVVALDIEAIELVARIIEACPGRAATYSEGHVSDYQRLSPFGQVCFVKAVRSAIINFLYWEKYVPFYRTLTPQPVEYLPYPYLLAEACSYYLQPQQRPALVALPSGLAGSTRNGLATLAVAKQLLDSSLIDQAACWLEPQSFQEDCTSIGFFLFSTPVLKRRGRLNWRDWLLSSRIDYRPLLRIKSKLERHHKFEMLPARVRIKNVSVYPRTSWPKYLAQLAQARVLIDLNDRETVGRNALDCAALGIACVSTARSDMQRRLFPETTLEDSWDVKTAFLLCRRLLQDKDFWEQVVTDAAKAVKQFDITVFRQRFESVFQPHSHMLKNSGR